MATSIKKTQPVKKTSKQRAVPPRRETISSRKEFYWHWLQRAHIFSHLPMRKVMQPISEYRLN